MEENRKRPGGGGDGEEIDGKRARRPATSEETDKSSEYEEMEALLSIDDESVTELSKLLETEEKSPAKVRFIDYPYSLPLIFQSSSSYITINGNEETCGSSFSDGLSSVMASVDKAGINIANRYWWFPDEDGVVERGRAAAAEAEVVERFGANGTNGYDCSDIDDEMLARFIGEDFHD